MQIADWKMQTENKRIWVIVEGRWSRAMVESRGSKVYRGRGSKVGVEGRNVVTIISCWGTVPATIGFG